MNKLGDANGNLYVVPMFQGVGADAKITLGQIKPDENWEDILGDWLGSIRLGGQENFTFGFDGADWYLQGSTTGDVCYDKYGEVVEEYGVANDVEININQGLIEYSTGGSTLNFSGEVLRGESELFTDANGNAYTGNFTPSEITLGDLVPNSDWEDILGDWLGTVRLGGQENFTFGFDGTDWYLRGSTTGDVCYDKDGQVIEEYGNANKFGSSGIVVGVL